ncbi:hypothetical protein [Streptomyces mirabilis]|uniref:hypothetical protein n=1 Tax=Streptomyces mirabilis TaxID=68239 RepID=UPI0036E3BD6E
MATDGIHHSGPGHTLMGCDVAVSAAGGVTPCVAAALVAAVHRVLFRPVQDLTPGARASPETAEIVADETRRDESMCAFDVLETWPRGPGGAAGRLLP